MRQLGLTIIIIFLITPSFSQEDFSGVYGYKMPLTKEMRKVYKELKPATDDFGYIHDLVLKRVSGNKYRFWLYVCKGFPSYNSGGIDGLIEFKNKKAGFLISDSTEEYCRLTFIVKGKDIYIDHDYEFGGCGFGANVTAEGNYPLKKKNVSNKDINNTYQEEISEVVIYSAKAFIYKNETDSVPTKQYFLKGNKIFIYSDGDLRVYTDYISSTGKLVSGWINKKDLDL